MAKTRRLKYRPNREPFSAPLAVPLTREARWSGCGTNYGPFSVVRFNFLLEHRPLEKFGYGNAAEHIEGSAGSQVTSRLLIRYEFERVTTSSILEEHLDSSEVVSRIQADIGLESPGLATFKLGSGLEEHLSSAFRETRTFEVTEARRSIREREVNVTVDGGSAPSVHAVAYRRWAMTVKLNHIDFLTIEYKKRAGGTRIQRLKDPQLPDSYSSHTNYRSSGLSLGEFRYWRPMGGAEATVIARSQHQDAHINPLHVGFHAHEDAKRRFYGLQEFRGTPSLYKISNAAFPLKHEQRRVAWTDEELLRLLDVEPKDAVWIWEFRRQLRRKRMALAGLL